MRIGHGFDVHAFGEGNHIILGGVRIPHTRGLVAHSDGDVATHALCDAILGALGRGDIGDHFPDSDPRWAGAHSLDFLRAVVEMASAEDLQIGNADVTVIAQAPRLHTYKDMIRSSLAQVLQVPDGRVNVKATTTERLGYIGREEGIAVHAVVLLKADD